MRKGLVGLFLGFLFLVFAPYNSYAEKCGCMGKMGEGMPMMEQMGKHLKGLGLDEKQKEAIKEIRSRVMKDTIKKRSDLQVARIELKDLLAKDPVDMNAVEAKLKQMESLKTDMHLSHIKAMEEIKAQLTPEQKEKFKEIFKKHRGWMRCDKGMNPSHKKKEEKQPVKE